MMTSEFFFKSLIWFAISAALGGGMIEHIKKGRPYLACFNFGALFYEMVVFGKYFFYTAWR